MPFVFCAVFLLALLNPWTRNRSRLKAKRFFVDNQCPNVRARENITALNQVRVMLAGNKYDDTLSSREYLRMKFSVLLRMASRARGWTEDDLRFYPQIREVSEFLVKLADSTGIDGTVGGYERPAREKLMAVVTKLPDEVIRSFSQTFLKRYTPIDVKALPRPVWPARAKQVEIEEKP